MTASRSGWSKANPAAPCRVARTFAPYQTERERSCQPRIELSIGSGGPGAPERRCGALLHGRRSLRRLRFSRRSRPWSTLRRARSSANLSVKQYQVESSSMMLPNGAARLSARAGCDASSDEVSPAVAASTDTAATAAGCGRTDTLSMKGSPRSRFPSKQCRRADLFLRRQLQNTVSACVRPRQRSRNIVLVATVDHTESHARNSLPELRASIAQPPGSQWALFNRKGQEPDSRFAHF